MPQLTTSQARVIDPVLTTVAQGYKNPDLVGNALFPPVPVGARGGKIVSFSKEDFRLYATGRVPGANTKRINYGYSSSSFALVQHALEGQVPFEIMQDANAVPGIDMGRIAVMKTQNVIGLDLEKAQADLATTAASYPSGNKVTLSGTNQWSDPASLPVKDIETAKEAVRAQIGRRANTVLLSAAAFSALRTNPQIVDRIKYTGRDTPTPELLAGLFGVQQVIIGDAVYENAAGTIADIWGKFVVVAYTEIGGLADMGLPSYGYTYRLGGYPLVEMAYQDRNAKSWIYPVTDEVAPVIAGITAGYLISAAVA